MTGENVFRDYYAEIELIDDQFGRLMNYLEETGAKGEQTLVIFMSDHGEMNGAMAPLLERRLFL